MEKYINGHLFNASIFDELKSNLKAYTNKLKTIEDIKGRYLYKGVQVAFIGDEPFASGYRITIENIITIGFTMHLWDDTETMRNKEYCYNRLVEELEGER